MSARLPILAIVLGTSLLLVAILADVLREAPVANFGTGQLALALLGALVAAAGLLVLRRPRLGERLRAAGQWLGAGLRSIAQLAAAALVMALALELVAAVVAGTSGGRDKIWLRIPEFASQEWAERHVQEYSQLEQGYRSYLLWRSLPFDGETIFVDADGVRRTPGAPPAPDAPEVVAFGGSAMWGTGVPDDLTLPAHLQRGLTAAMERPVRVTNRAERGYVSTQSLLALTLELRAGRVPDLVIFYDGFNDLGVTTGAPPGGHYAEARVAGRLERPLSTLLLASRTADLARQLLRIRPSFEHLTADEERERLAEEIVAVYLGNYALVDALSRTYGFSYLFFWQPALVTSGKQRTSAEDLLYGDPAREWVELYRRVYARIADEAAARENLFTLADAFDRETSSMFIDDVHVTPRANEILAARMLEIMIPRLRSAEDPPPAAVP